MRLNLRAVACAAGIGAMGVCLVGCKSDTSWSNHNTAYAEGGTISGGTGITGSSASPYTRDKPVSRTYSTTPMPYQTSPYYYNPDKTYPPGTYPSNTYPTSTYPPGTYPKTTYPDESPYKPNPDNTPKP